MDDRGAPLFLCDEDVAALLTPDAVFASQFRAFEALASGTAVLPQRLLLDGDGGSTAFCYAARTSPAGPAVSKFGSVNPDNAARGLPTVSATVTVLDPVTGRLLATMEATTLTTLRTAGASAVAVDRLARHDARVLAVVGTGVQAEAHVEALLPRRGWEEILVVGRTPERSESLVTSLLDRARPVPVRAVDTATALARADVVALCTSSREPIVDASAVRPGTTVVTVGSFAPDRREVGAELIATAHVVVDDVSACSSDSAPVIDALAAGLVTRADLHPLGDVLLGRAVGRPDDDAVVVHVSSGLGIQDAAIAEAVLAALARLRPGALPPDR